MPRWPGEASITQIILLARNTLNHPLKKTSLDAVGRPTPKKWWSDPSSKCSFSEFCGFQRSMRSISSLSAILQIYPEAWLTWFVSTVGERWILATSTQDLIFQCPCSSCWRFEEAQEELKIIWSMFPCRNEWMKFNWCKHDVILKRQWRIRHNLRYYIYETILKLRSSAE